MRSFVLLLPALAGGCIAQVEIDVDPDEDGLADVDEVRLGSDPGNPDSDADGWTDGDEVSTYTDPVNADDHPFQSGWPIDACRNDIEGEGTAIGDVAPNFALANQFGETVRLHDFCGQVVYLVFAAFW